MNFKLKPLYIATTLTLFLTGCQLTDSNNNDDLFVNHDPAIEIADPTDISEALTADETANVFHPVEDVDIALTDKPVLTVEDDIWQRIRNNLSFEVEQNRRVIVQRNWYAKHPGYLERVAKRAEPFMYYILEELEANNIPVEIALLPIVESAFDPFAYSHGRASGMWQFVPATGKRFGMQQNWWYDGRRDVVASTEGAIKYLTYLNKMFDGDWLLALAAYNSGEGRVLKAVKRNARKGLPTDFWSLDLPKETRAYVPKLLALADLVKRPQDFDLNLYALENKPVIGKVEIDSQIDLALAADLAELSLAEFQRLNPGYNRWATEPGTTSNLLIPLNKLEGFNEKLNKVEKKDRVTWQRYQIKRGDSLIKIANKFHTTATLIKEINNIKGTQIRAGKHLLIPTPGKSLDSYTLSQEQRLAAKQNRQQSGTKINYKVQSGDNLWDISRAHKVSHRSLAKWNGIAPTDPIKPGQTLVIWKKTPTTDVAKVPETSLNSNAVMRNIIYQVRNGDSLARIASKFNVTIAQIEGWNNINRKKYLQPGQKLNLKVDVTNI